MKSKLTKLTALICNLILIVQCNSQRPLAPSNKPIVENIKPAPIKSGHNSKQNKNQSKTTGQKTDGEIYVSKIVPDNSIPDFYIAISESIILTVSYKNDKKLGKINESNFSKYINDLTRAYAILLYLKMDKNMGSARELAIEINNCGNNLRELIDQFTVSK